MGPITEVHHIETQTETVSQDAAHEAVHWVPKVGISVLIFLSFCIAAALISRFIRKLNKHAPEQKQVVIRLLVQVINITLIMVGATMALGTVGINISPIIAGLGLTGFAVGFALKDIVSNVISGSMILIFQTFQVKDVIAVTGFDGTVIDIQLRYTVLSKDGKYILIPNSSIFSNPVVITPATKEQVTHPTTY